MLNAYSKSKLNIKVYSEKRNTKTDKPDILQVFAKCSDTPKRIKASGKAIITLCPFHDDQKPSFALYKDTNTYYCFSCGATGDSYDLAMKLLGYDFKAALEFCQDNSLFSY